ncbi:MAG: glycosyltransferase family 2 protein [Lachnospiraceae bacterium]|nr:glycosyltransferase family 2 protein [Lachnospiraceae bacterium]
MDTKLLISVIIPVYNVHLYLRQCLDSVILQTYQNLEIILVDDGSTDESGIICDEYAKKDMRIKVIHQVNEGQASARNHGLQYARGEYITYIDSDDYVANNYIECMITMAEEFKADLVHCCMEKFWKHRNEKGISENFNIKVYTASEALNEYCYQNRFMPSPCCKLIHISLIENIKFPVNMGYEDAATMYKVIGNAKKIVFMQKVMYYYRQHNMSTMHAGFSDKKVDRIRVAEQLKQYIDINFPENSRAANTRYILANFQLLMDLPYSKEYIEIRKEVEENIKNVRRRVIFDNKSKISIKIIAMISYLGSPVLICLGKIYKKMNY